MNCYLIYHKADAEKNSAYIDLYRMGCKQRGLGFSLLFYEDLTAQDPGLTQIRRFLDGFVINRTRETALSTACENAGIPVRNSSRLVTLGNDKLAAYEYVSSLGLPVLRTAASPEELDPSRPCVMKTVDGHGGSEVFLINSPAEEDDIRRRFPGVGIPAGAGGNSQQASEPCIFLRQELPVPAVRHCQQDRAGQGDDL